MSGAIFQDSGLFDNDAVNATVERHASGAFDHNQAIWSLLMFEGWLGSVHDGTAVREQQKPGREFMTEYRETFRDLAK